ncbi:uncharacterized [Tachysurus ichikawai]
MVVEPGVCPRNVGNQTGKQPSYEKIQDLSNCFLSDHVILVRHEVQSVSRESWVPDDMYSWCKQFRSCSFFRLAVDLEKPSRGHWV